MNAFASFLTALAVVSCAPGEPASPASPAEKGEGKHGDEHGGEHEHEHGEEHSDEVKLTQAASKQLTLAKATSELLADMLSVPGRVALDADAIAHVGTPLRGVAVEVLAKVGTIVAAGDVLAVVESPELGEAQSELLLRRAAVRAAEPMVALAKSTWSRTKLTFERAQAVPLGEVQRLEAEYRAAAAQLANNEALVVAADARLRLLGMTEADIESLSAGRPPGHQIRLRAPVKGEVISRGVTQGEVISPDDDELFVLADTSSLWILAEVPEAVLPTIVVGTKAWIVGPSGPASRTGGTVVYLPPTVDSTTRTAQVRLVAKDSSHLRAGMFASVELTLSAESAAHATVVPEAAVQDVEGSPSVFVPVPDEPNTFARRAIAVGRTVGDRVEVLDGLRAGDEIVVEGSFLLKAELGKSEAAHEH